MGKLFFGLVAWVITTCSQAVTLQWDVPTDDRIAGYELHYGTSSGQYTEIQDVPGPNTDTVEIDTGPGTWYFAARSRNIDGTLVSVFSNEVIYSPGSTGTTPANPENVEIVYAKSDSGSPMAIAYISATHIEDSASDSSSAVTIPVGTDAVVVAGVGHQGVSTGIEFFEELDWDGTAGNDFTHIGTSVYRGGGNDPLVGLFVMTADSVNWPGTGSKTIYWKYPTATSTMDVGISISIMFFSGVHQTDPVRTSEVVDMDDISATTYDSSLSGVIASDFTVGVAEAYNTTPVADPTGYGQTVVLEDIYRQFGIGVHYEQGEDIMRFENLVSGDSGIVWGVLKAAAAAGLSIPVAMHHYTKNIGQ